ncbi:MAG: AAA family ATPase [Magnetococcales bacterium]|nr:AAA family ATPase [Magnetococcales bacterium]
MLKKLSISGFKSILDAQLEFGRVNLFIGANGSGKSNILEAIGVLSTALCRDITETELQRKGVRLSEPVLFKSAFKACEMQSNFGLKAELEGDVCYHINITAGESIGTLRFFSEEILHDSISYLGRSNHGIRLQGVSKSRDDVSPERGLWDRFQSVIDLPDVLVNTLNKLARFCIYAPQTSFLRGTESERTQIKPIGLLGGGLPQAAATVFEQIEDLQSSNRQHAARMREILEVVWMPGWASACVIDHPGLQTYASQAKSADLVVFFVDRFLRSERNLLSAYDSSEGSLYLLFMAILMLHPESPKLFALDNVDNSLNPAATRAFLEKIIYVTGNQRFQRYNIGPEQVFLTSHNPTSLDAFDLFNDDQRVFVVSRASRTGFTTVYRLQPAEGMTKAKWIKTFKGKNLSELWIDGSITDALGVQGQSVL